MRGCGAHLRGHRSGLTGADIWARRAGISRRYELARSTEGAQVSKEETGRLVVCGVWGVAPVGLHVSPFYRFRAKGTEAKRRRLPLGGSEAQERW